MAERAAGVDQLVLPMGGVCDRPSHVTIGLVLFGATLLILSLGGCTAPPARTAYSTISDATTVVKASVVAYKRHCGVPIGRDGPGTCPAAEYHDAEIAYALYQDAATRAVDIAQTTGLPPLEIVSAAAAQALVTIAAWEHR